MPTQCPNCQQPSDITYRCEHCGRDLVDTTREVSGR